MKEYGCTNKDCSNTVEWYDNTDGTYKCPCGSPFILDPEFQNMKEYVNKAQFIINVEFTKDRGIIGSGELNIKNVSPEHQIEAQEISKELFDSFQKILIKHEVAILSAKQLLDKYGEASLVDIINQIK